MPGHSILDPRQQAFITGYMDPESPTYLNTYRSALAAGYKNEYAENIMSLMPKWLSRQLEYKDRIVVKAKRKLEDFLDNEKLDKKLQLDATKFTLKTLGKDEGFSERTEQVSQNINFNLEVTDQEFKTIIAQFARRKQSM